MKFKTIIIILLVFILAACSPQVDDPATTPSPTETAILPTPENAEAGSPGLGDPYFPGYGNGGYDVEHYLIDLDVNMDENIIAGRTVIQALATQDLNQLNLDFIGFDISQINVDGASTTFERNASELTISVPPKAEGQRFEIEVSYSGTPGEGIDTSELDGYELGWGYYGDGVYVAGEPSGSSTWYPVNEHPLDKALYSYEITVADPYQVAANGTLQEIIAGIGESTFIWSSQDPIASYLVTIAIAEFDRVEEIGPNGLLIRNYFGKDVANFVRDDFDTTADMIAYFNDIFGPYPFESYGVVVHDLDLRFALETQTLSVFGRSFTTPEVVAHELAHAWFGDSVTLATWNDIWLNEGFATYASVLWAEHALGTAEAEEILRDMYAAMAPGETSYQLSRTELANAIPNLLTNNSYSANTTKIALTELFRSTIEESELNAALEGLEGDSFEGNQIGEFVGTLAPYTFDLPGSRLAAFFTALGEEELALDFSSTFPVPGDPSADNLFSRSVYQRGALTLHSLRLHIGDDAFFNSVRSYAEKFQNSNASTSDFIAISEEVSGQDLDQLFSAWLYEQPIPDIPELDLFYEDFAIQ